MLGVCLAMTAAATAAAAQEKPASAAGEDTRRAISVGTRFQLFATLCALDAAGYDPGTAAAPLSPGREQLRKRMLALEGPATAALRAYYREHALADPGATLSRFVSFALVAGPPPQFAFELRREDLPPDALALEGFNPILAVFSAEAQLDQLWERYQPDYERGVEMYRAPVSEIVFQATTYLREIVKSNSPRSFTVYVEPLVGPAINFRNYGDHYALVLSPGSEIPADEIRHAFLHFILDPLAIRHRQAATRLQPLLESAARAPRLPREFHDDVSAFLSECMVRAAELRLRHLSPAALVSAMDQADSAGYVMVRPIYAGLSRFEKSEPAMRYYLPDLIKGIDVSAELRRLRGVQFAEVASPGDLHQPAPSSASKSNPAADSVAEDLMEGQRQIAVRNGAAAAASFEKVLAARPQDARATYGLAVASALLGQPARARELFAKVIEASGKSSPEPQGSPDPSMLSWSHIYLGRMYDVEGNRDLAVTEYQAALAVGGAPESARAAARRGVESGYQTPPRQSKPGGAS